ncbi:MAG: AAA family ATPase, partial [Proteobacteria bacterium]|nr:AAA family ATPase [Pseudomonadota bacterium]
NEFTSDPQYNVQLRMRIGLNTGPVLLGKVGMTGEFTAMGNTVNLASRLEHAAPVGGILISYNTYRHARGVFDVQELDPIVVKGKADPIQVYVVQRAKPHAFRVGTRGIEGIETRMIGRVTELQQLQQTLQHVIQLRASRLVTVVGDAGIGKSRLLYEFSNWVEQLSRDMWIFKARASEQSVNLPFSLIRYMFAARFQIQESDSTATVHEKLVDGITGFMGPDAEAKAHFIGHLLGFDFSASPHLHSTLSNPRKIRDQAFLYVAQFFHAVSVSDNDNPFIIFLEDLHWADESSLDLIEYIVQECRDDPMFIAFITRSALFEHREFWGMMWDHHSRFEIKPLSKEDSSQLVDELLQKLDEIPKMLREVIVTRAEGNPYYHEEIVKMLITDGVIIKGPEKWHIAAERLITIKVPATLTGVLQARLDRLPAEEKIILQRASVVGRVFWDSAVIYLSRADNLTEADINAALSTLVGRELIFERKASTFAESQEFVFKNTIFRDVAYESVLRRSRRKYHTQVAEWMIERSGERVAEHIGLIADHFGSQAVILHQNTRPAAIRRILLKNSVLK